MSRAAPPLSQANLQNILGSLQQGYGALAHQQMRLKQKVYALEAAEKLRALNRAPALPIEFKSQFGEDLFIWDLLGGKLDGFFIEVGAFDGYNYAVTYALEAVGWKGLLIEAIPERADACAKLRKNSRVVNAALSRRGSTGTTSFTVTEDQWGGMLSYLDANTDHAKSQAGAKKRTVTVPLTTMNELLKDHTGPIDVAVIDVEGGEVPLLDGFDLLKFKPKVLMLEDNTRGQDPALANYMSTLPYRQVGWVEVNRVYVRADATDVFERARYV